MMAFRAGHPPITDLQANLDRAVRPYRDTLRAIRRLAAQREEGLISAREATREIDTLAARTLGDR